MRLMSAAFIAIAFVIAPMNADEAPTVAPTDFEGIDGTDWTGSLTYLNYQPPYKDFTIPTNLEVETKGASIELFFKYPDEPHMNGSSQLEIGESGKALGGERVISKTVLEDGSKEVRTRGDCKDMGKPASCEMIYTLSVNSISLKKMVTYEGETEAFRRNEYTFTR